MSSSPSSSSSSQVKRGQRVEIQRGDYQRGGRQEGDQGPYETQKRPAFSLGIPIVNPPTQHPGETVPSIQPKSFFDPQAWLATDNGPPKDSSSSTGVVLAIHCALQGKSSSSRRTSS